MEGLPLRKVRSVLRISLIGNALLIMLTRLTKRILIPVVQNNTKIGYVNMSVDEHMHITFQAIQAYEKQGTITPRFINSFSTSSLTYEDGLVWIYNDNATYLVKSEGDQLIKVDVLPIKEYLTHHELAESMIRVHKFHS